MHNEVKMSIPKEPELGLGKQQMMAFPGMGAASSQVLPVTPRTLALAQGQEKKPLNTFQWQPEHNGGVSNTVAQRKELGKE